MYEVARLAAFEEALMTQAGTKDHPITIEPIHERVRVIWHGRTIGDSKSALELREANYPPVVYVPRADMDMSALERTARVTTCPYKGEANYFSITDGKARDDNAVWTYELPIAGVGEIGSHLAFYPDKVEITRGG
jgi:uncharacterized protein (DUF427 family)